MTVCCTVLCELSWPRLMLKTGLYIKLKVLFRGIYFLAFVLKNPLLIQEKHRSLNENQTFDKTKNSKQCAQKDTVR
jgi:hypothetical protein